MLELEQLFYPLASRIYIINYGKNNNWSAKERNLNHLFKADLSSVSDKDLMLNKKIR